MFGVRGQADVEGDRLGFRLSVRIAVGRTRTVVLNDWVTGGCTADDAASAAQGVAEIGGHVDERTGGMGPERGEATGLEHAGDGESQRKSQGGRDRCVVEIGENGQTTGCPVWTTVTRSPA